MSTEVYARTIASTKRARTLSIPHSFRQSAWVIIILILGSHLKVAFFALEEPFTFFKRHILKQDCLRLPFIL
jgi:hypothetical protein